MIHELLVNQQWSFDVLLKAILNLSRSTYNTSVCISELFMQLVRKCYNKLFYATYMYIRM